MNQEPWILASHPLPSEEEDKWDVPALLILYSKTLPFPLPFPSLACSYYCWWCRASIDPTKSGRPIYGKREKIKNKNHKVGVEPLLSFARYPRLSRLEWVSGWVSKWTLSHIEVQVRSREGRESGEKGLPLLSPPLPTRGICHVLPVGTPLCYTCDNQYVVMRTISSLLLQRRGG